MNNSLNPETILYYYISIFNIKVGCINIESMFTKLNKTIEYEIIIRKYETAHLTQDLQCSVLMCAKSRYKLQKKNFQFSETPESNFNDSRKRMVFHKTGIYTYCT